MHKHKPKVHLSDKEIDDFGQHFLFYVAILKNVYRKKFILKEIWFYDKFIDRYGQTIGCYCHSTKKIVFDMTFFRTVRRLKRTAIHELSHMVEWQKYKRRRKRHDKEFYDLMAVVWGVCESFDRQYTYNGKGKYKVLG